MGGAVTDGGVSLSYEYEKWLVIARQLEQLVHEGYTGETVLQWQNGVVKHYSRRHNPYDDERQAEEERRVKERRDAPRDGEDRRRKE